ncbi:MAG: segregation and condensation protein A [Thermodesulfobacteriota bacterium]
MSFTAKLDLFEGPLDLLLHLVKVNEVDLADIPIAAIADQYLEYLELMKALDINVAGEFLIMASTLMHLKSKMLLPKQDQDLEEIEELMEEVIRPLKEYKQFKEAAEKLFSRNILSRDVFRRASDTHLMIGEENEGMLPKVNLFELMMAFKEVMAKRFPHTVLNFEAERWSIQEKIDEIRRLMERRKTIHFSELFSSEASLSELIASFLALLELVRTGFLAVYQEKPGDDIVLQAVQ